MAGKRRAMVEETADQKRAKRSRSPSNSALDPDPDPDLTPSCSSSSTQLAPINTVWPMLHTSEHVSPDGFIGSDADGIIVERDASGSELPPSLPARNDQQDEICYGMIHEVNCRLIPGCLGRPHSESFTDVLDGKYLRCSLQRQDDDFRLSLAHENIIAHLNQKISSALCSLDDASVRLTPYVRLTDIKRLADISSITKKKTFDFFAIHINIFGESKYAASASRLLSEKHVFLQDPLWLEDHTCYANPQLISFDHVDLSVGLSELHSRDHGEEHDSLHSMYNTVLDRLPQYHASSPAPLNELITTKLKRHQIDGQSFMLRRESGELEGELSFWRRECNEDGTTLFRHTITGRESQEKPVAPLGGILADDMGLGKTLTTIALISHSLPLAHQFASCKSSRRAVQSTRATLVVVPSMLILEAWAQEIARRVKPGSLRVTKYHGHCRARHYSALLDHDVVLTTYGTITTEWRNAHRREALYHLRWFRIVLDEAHTIRSQNTQQFKAITDLKSRHNWCLTGTPIANRIEDLGALISFCRVPELEDPDSFRRHVTKYTRRFSQHGCEILHQTLLPICIRRTKALLDDLLPPNLLYCHVSLNEIEGKYYNDIVRHSRRTIEENVSGHKTAKARHTVLQTILSLRLYCNHGTMANLASVDEERLDPDEALTLLQEAEEDHCLSCGSEVKVINQMLDPSSGAFGACGHVICRSCLPTDEFDHQARCPACNETMSYDDASCASSMSASGTAEAPSTKMQKILENLLETDGKEKSIVFSMWKRSIDLISRLCTIRGIKHVCIDGRTLQARRREALDQFTKDSKTSVLLMTFGTGALGLTLTAGSRIHIVEPQWNPAVEEQAIGRAVRIGQANQTTVIRYIVKGTVEEQIQGYQKRKIQLAAGGFGESAEAETETQAKLLTASFLQNTI